MRLKIAAIGLLGVVLSISGNNAWGQASDAALRDRVMQLVEKLGAPKVEARKAAEEALIKLGPKVLPFLPEAAKSDSAERKEQLARIREALIQASEEIKLDASKITIKGEGIRLTEAIQKLQTQSGNVITDIREANGAEATNP